MKFSYEELKKILTDDNRLRASRQLGKIASPIEVIDWWLGQRAMRKARLESTVADNIEDK